MTSIELGWIEKELNDAATKYEVEKARLYRQDGTAKYAPTEHKEREAALLAPIHEIAERARAAVQVAHDEAAQEATIADFDPLLALASANSDLVMVKQSIIGPSVESSSLEDLARRLAAVAVHGDEVDRRLYVMHANRRLEGLKREIQRTKQSPAGYGAASTALLNLTATLVDEKAALKVKSAAYKKDAATKLSMYVTSKVNEVTGADQRAKAAFADRLRQYA